MPRLIRAAALTNYAEVAKSVGLDPRRMVLDAGLTLACLDARELRISADAVGELLEASSAASGVEGFALMMVEGRRISNLGLLGMLSRQEADLRSALQSFGKYGRTHNEAVVQRIEEANGIATLFEELVTQYRGSTRQSMELLLGVVVRIIKVLVGAEWRPKRVCFTHAEPSNIALHRRIFGLTPEFSCEFNGLVLTSADLDTPIATADPIASEFLHRQLDQTATSEDSVVEEIRQMIVLLIPGGRCTASQIAQLMGFDRRTVHRKLRREGHTFHDLVNETRCMLASRFILARKRALSEVANLLGFAHQSSFSRWYKEVFGITPEEARNHQFNETTLSQIRVLGRHSHSRGSDDLSTRGR